MIKELFNKDLINYFIWNFFKFCILTVFIFLLVKNHESFYNSSFLVIAMGLVYCAAGWISRSEKLREIEDKLKYLESMLDQKVDR